MTSTPLPLLPTPPTRPSTSVLPPPEKTPSFILKVSDKSYKHQYANIYFVRLRLLREFVQENAKKRWKEIAGGPKYVPRVLEVLRGELSYIIGTVYMDMPLKPNVLEDLARDQSIPSPPPRAKYISDNDQVMLEDESGRICLVGDRIQSAGLVTGVILGALGMETNSGDFDVIDFCYAGLPPQWPILPDGVEEEDMDIDGPSHSQGPDEWVALVSGLDIGEPSPEDAQIDMLVEYLTGELGGTDEQSSAARVSRLIIAGNSLAPVITDENPAEDTSKKARQYGHDHSTFSSHPTLSLSAHLLDLAGSMPIHVLPGASDPSGTILPQQPLPRGLFGKASAYSSFQCESNPTYIHLGSPLSPSNNNSSSKPSTSKTKQILPTPSWQRTILVNSGQPLNDMVKYLSTPPHTRLSMAESTLRWRHLAPTAPDTLWCHPYFSADPFIISESPHLYVIGNQPEFKTKLIRERGDGEQEVKKCRVVLLPSFRETGVVALVNLRDLSVRTVRFGVNGMRGS